VLVVNTVALTLASFATTLLSITYCHSASDSGSTARLSPALCSSADLRRVTPKSLANP